MDDKVEIYRGVQGEVVFSIDKGMKTIWATEEQIAQVFGVDRSVINRHVRNIYKDGELGETGTCVKNAQVRMEGNRKVMREIRKYNLDMIISVGYRVNSRKATDFRIWATRVLKKYVVDGVAINEKRLEEIDREKLAQLEGTLAIVRRMMVKSGLEAEETRGILEVISKYADSFQEIKEFSEGHISFVSGRKMRRGISMMEAENLIENLSEQEEVGGKFGRFRDERAEKKFEDELAKLEEKNNSIAEKAVRLLYFIVREEPFFEGNGRIGALLFIFFLTVNDYHLTENGETKISDKALTALVLLFKESNKEEEELVVKVARKLLEG